MGWTSNYKITSNFGGRTDPFTGEASNHGGMDIGVPANTAIGSTTSGKVIFAGKGTGKSASFGNFVIVQDSQGNKHYYAHLNGVNVKAGQQINADTVIGKSGSTGRSTGAHLHYEVRDANGSQKNPSSWMQAASQAVMTPETNTKATNLPYNPNSKPVAKHTTGKVIKQGLSYTNTWKTDKEAAKSSSYKTYKTHLSQALDTGKIPKSPSTVVALTELIGRESTWNPKGDNPTSSAYGYGQFINDTVNDYEKKTGLNYGNPVHQILMTYQYTIDRYGSPEKALQFWDKNNWY